MASFKASKVTTLPGTLVADTIYFVQNGNYAECYVTNAAGVAKMIGNTLMIQQIADARITAQLANINMMEYAADITARNALTAGATHNLLVFVANATGDATVASGAATYFWRQSNASWTKVAEFESMDLSLTWANISGKPSSTAGQIDAAVASAHSHTNKAQLDLISEAAGTMTYNGQPVASNWAATDW